MTIPGIGHFDNGFVLPVRTSKTSGVMRYFSYRDSCIAVLPKPGRHAGRGDFGVCGQLLSPIKKSRVSRSTVPSGQQCISGGPACGGLDVVLIENLALRCESVDIWRVNVVDSIAIQLGSKVVDTDEQDIGLVSCRSKRKGRSQSG